MKAKYNQMRNGHYYSIMTRYEIEDIKSFIRAARRAECHIERWCEYMCGDGCRDYEANERRFYEVVTRCIDNLAKRCGKPDLFRSEIWVNRDPRGYALKLSAKQTEFVDYAYIDWGSNVILAPDFNA